MKSTLIYLFIGIVAFASLVLRQTDNNVEPSDLKEIFLELCEENDSKACISAVNTQFDSCLNRYKVDWDNFMKSRGDRVDQAMDELAYKLASCIVDKDGEPFLTYDKEDDES